MGNLVVHRKKDLSIFRTIALGTWKTVGDPSVYGNMLLPMDEALRYLEKFREVKGKRLTVSHLMAKAMAAVLLKMPDANAVLRWGRIYVRKDIGIFFQVATKDEETGEIDLSGTTIRNPDKKTLEEIVDDFQSKVKDVKTGKDEELENTRKSFRMLPWFLVGTILKLIAFLTVTLNLNLKWAGIPRDPFGSMMITNVGSLGLEEAYVPLVPYSRVPLLLALGAIKKIPVVENDEVVIRQTMRVFATLDHRIMDGAHAAICASTLKEWFENPFEHFDPLD